MLTVVDGSDKTGFFFPHITFLSHDTNLLSSKPMSLARRSPVDLFAFHRIAGHQQAHLNYLHVGYQSVWHITLAISLLCHLAWYMVR